MNKRQRLSLERYFVECAAILGLSEWQIRVDAELIDDGLSEALIRPLEQYRTADVQVSADFFAMTPADQRAHVAHELGHLWTARMDKSTEYLDKDEARVKLFKRVFEDAEEYAVEQIARVIAALLPLPVLGHKKSV